MREWEKKLNYKNQGKISYICKDNKIFDICRLPNQDCIINGNKKILIKSKRPVVEWKKLQVTRTKITFFIYQKFCI